MITMRCGRCASARMMKDGVSESGKQRYRCGNCGKRSRANARVAGVSAEKEAQVLCALSERMNLRACARTFGLSRNTITALLEKKTL